MRAAAPRQRTLQGHQFLSGREPAGRSAAGDTRAATLRSVGAPPAPFAGREDAPGRARSSRCSIHSPALVRISQRCDCPVPARAFAAAQHLLLRIVQAETCLSCISPKYEPRETDAQGSSSPLTVQGSLTLPSASRQSGQQTLPGKVRAGEKELTPRSRDPPFLPAFTPPSANPL